MPLITDIRTPRSSRRRAESGRSGAGEWRVLVLDDGRHLRIDVEQVARHGLEPGGPLDAHLAARLEAREAYGRARERALRLLAVRPRSAHEIRQRLLRDRVPLATISPLIADLMEQGVVDDLQFARAWIAGRTGTRPLGARRLRWELRSKGVPPPVIDRALRDCLGEAGDIARAEARSARALVRAARERYDHLPPDRRVRRIAALLERRGYAAGTIARVLRGAGGAGVTEVVDG